MSEERGKSRFMDGHTHHYFSNYSTLKLLKEEGYEGAAVLSYFPIKPSCCCTLKDLYTWLTHSEKERFKSLKLTPYIGLGIHPRNIYGKMEEEIKEIERNIEESAVIGEVGLEKGSIKEQVILKKQLKLARDYGKPVIIHTPRKNKQGIFELILKILEETRIKQEQVMIDHLTRNQLEKMENNTYYIGLTVQPGKLTQEKVYYIIKSYPKLIDRIILNSDCGREPSDPLAVKKTVDFLLKREVDSLVLEKISRGNFINFIKIRE